MNQSSDLQLLRDYAENHAEADFGELVRRHLDLVYSAALRMVRDPHLAEDVTQAVFIALAKNASQLLDRPVISGWLHRTAQNIAAQTVRTTERRRAREQEAFAMNELLSAGSDISWDHIAPHLDAALGELSEPDRDALFLRYFEKKSAREMAAQLGISDEAAQKRVSRAVERLREFLAKRGVTIGASGLIVVISVNAVQAAPAGLAVTIPTAWMATVSATAAPIPTLGVFTLMTSAKITTLIATLAALLLVGGAALKFHRGNSDTNKAQEANSNQPPRHLPAADTNHVRPERTGPSPSSMDAQTDPVLAYALARLREVLYDPKIVRELPDSELEAAMQDFGDRRTAAMPLLREALKSGIQQVRRRAAEGLGLIGTEAGESVPDLVRMMESNNSMSDANAGAVALSRIGPVPEVLPDLARILKNNSNARGNTMANFIPNIAGSDLDAVSRAFRPLLQDSDPEVRQTSAYLLSMALKSQAGPDVIKAAIEMLNSDDDNNLRMAGMSTLRNAGQDRQAPMFQVTTNALGAATEDVVAALMHVATTTKRDDLRGQVLQLLDGLKPDFRQQYPHIGAWLKNQEESDAFVRKVQSGQAATAELLEGISRFPGSASAVAQALANTGADAQAVMPALQNALTALAPSADATPADHLAAYRAREQLANAMQRIAPDQPKALFTQSDMRSVMPLLLDPAIRTDAARSQKISAIRQSVFGEAPGRGMESTPEQMHRLLDALNGADRPTYEAIAAKVEKIDPQFFSKSGH